MIRRVRVVFEIYIDDRRGIDLLDHTNWSLVIIDDAKSKLIYDTQLKRKGETTFRPSITILDK